MNIFSLFGLLIAVIVLTAGLKMSSDNLNIFFDGPSLFIVLGGTFAASSIAFQINKIGAIFKIFFKNFLMGKMVDNTKLIENVMSICSSLRSGESLESLSSKATDEFLVEGITLISDGILEKKDLIEILGKRANQMAYIRSEQTRKIKALGKFPPAFGMMGTTIGMVVLLANLGGADAMKTIGPAMGVCLITTLYGVIIANLALIPIAENLEEIQRQMNTKDRIILEGIKHIMEKSNPIIVAEDLNSYLDPKERLDWKSVA